MNQRRRRTIVSCLTALFIATLGLYLILQHRTQIATQLLIRELTKRGIGVDSLELEELGIHGVALRTIELKLTNGWIVVLEGVNASYSKNSLGSRQLESVEINRARFVQPQTTTQSASPSAESRTGSLSLPFDTLKCRRVELSLIAMNSEVVLNDLSVARSEDNGSVSALASGATFDLRPATSTKDVGLTAKIAAIQIRTLVDSLSQGRIDSIHVREIAAALSTPPTETSDPAKSERSRGFQIPDIAVPFSSLSIDSFELRGVPVVDRVSFKQTEVVANAKQKGFVFSAGAVLTRVFDGEIIIEPLSVHSGRKQNSVLVRLREVDLKSVLALYEEQGVSGTGLVDGELPVELIDGSVTVKGGRISVRKPGGILRYEGAAVPGSVSDGRLNLVREALKNYHYDLLEAGVDYNAEGDAIVQASIEGANPDLNMTQPIHVNLTVSENVPSLLRSLEVAGKLEEAVRGAVNGK